MAGLPRVPGFGRRRAGGLSEGGQRRWKPPFGSRSGRDALASPARLSLARPLPRRGYESACIFTIRTVNRRLFGGRDPGCGARLMNAGVARVGQRGSWAALLAHVERPRRSQPLAAKAPSCGSERERPGAGPGRSSWTVRHAGFGRASRSRDSQTGVSGNRAPDQLASCSPATSPRVHNTL